MVVPKRDTIFKKSLLENSFSKISLMIMSSRWTQLLLKEEPGLPHSKAPPSNRPREYPELVEEKRSPKERPGRNRKGQHHK